MGQATLVHESGRNSGGITVKFWTVMGWVAAGLGNWGQFPGDAVCPNLKIRFEPGAAASGKVSKESGGFPPNAFSPVV